MPACCALPAKITSMRISMTTVSGWLAVDLACAQHERVDDGAAQRFECRVESGRGQCILEFEFDPETNARAALGDWLEAPMAGQVAKRPFDEVHDDFRVGGQVVARRELRAQHAACDVERGHLFV